MSPLNTIAESLRAAAHTLIPHSDSPRLDAELLLAKVLGVARSALIAHNERPVTGICARAFARLIAQRAAGTPVAYLTGSREFWSLELKVTPAVLVPRPETEILVERALALIPRDGHCRLLDVGTGSGAIALAIASERPRCAIVGVDLSEPALSVAARNSARLNLTHIDWRLGCWFDPVAGERFNIIVANPPYIAAQDAALEKLHAEPAMALRAGPKGLDALAAIIAAAPRHLLKDGWLVLEHGAGQAPDVASLLDAHGFASIRTYPDFSGTPRVTLGTVHTQH
jgi:release factor glutamine methyltransferase